MYRSVADTAKGVFVRGYSDGGSPRVYAEMMQRLDDGVGRIIGALGKSGLERDTFVVFTSDNGGERYSYNWPLSEGKSTLNEGGIRVPAIVRWPGRAPAGHTVHQTVITMDWTATMLALAGATADPVYPLDGVDLTPVCRGEAARLDRSLFWRTRKQAAVRRGDWKYLRTDAEESLFYVPTDPGEQSDLAASKPEILATLRAEFQRWNNQMLPLPGVVAGPH